MNSIYRKNTKYQQKLANFEIKLYAQIRENLAQILKAHSLH